MIRERHDLKWADNGEPTLQLVHQSSDPWHESDVVLVADSEGTPTQCLRDHDGWRYRATYVPLMHGPAQHHGTVT